MSRLAATALLLWAAQAAAVDVETVEFVSIDDTYVLTLSARLDAPILAVFAVLTDYERLDELHASIRQSKVLARPDPGTAEVFTVLRGCVAFFCRNLTRIERVRASPPAFVEAVILPETGDFDSGQVRWDMRVLPDGRTHVDYVAEIRPRFWVPPVIGTRLLSRAMRRTTGELLREVEALAAPAP